MSRPKNHVLFRLLGWQTSEQTKHFVLFQALKSVPTMLPLQSKQEHRVWVVQDVVALIVRYLDLQSTLVLAKTHKSVLEVLKKNAFWKKLLKRNFPLDGQERVRDFLSILALLKTPSGHLQELLHAVCESYRIEEASSVQASTGRKVGSYLLYGEKRSLFDLLKVQVVFPVNKSLVTHSISLSGFEIIGEIEEKVGATVFVVESVDFEKMKLSLTGPTVNCSGSIIVSENFLPTLRSRLLQQEQKMSSLKIGCVLLKSEDDAVVLQTLVEAADAVQLGGLLIETAIGQQGWDILAQLLLGQPGLVEQVKTSKDCFEGVTVETLQVVWENLPHNGRFIVCDWFSHHILKESENGWNQLLEWIA